MEKNTEKTIGKEQKKLVIFKKVSDNQTFCFVNTKNNGDVLVAEIAVKNGELYVDYKSSKLSKEIRDEIVAKYVEMTKQN